MIERALISRLKVPHWSWFILALLFIGYWVMATSMERVNAHMVLARFFMPELTAYQAEATYFPTPLLWVVKLLHPRVWRHIVPVLVGWWLARQAAISLIQTFNDWPDRRAAADFLHRQRIGEKGGSGAPFVARPGNLEKGREESIFLSAGGPMQLAIPAGFVGVTEQNGRYRRILQPGVRSLDRYERLFDVIDMRPQEKRVEKVRLVTAEGLPIWADITMTVQINLESDLVAGPGVPYGEAAIREAAYRGAVGADGQVASWSDRAVDVLCRSLTKEVSLLPMDDLIAVRTQSDAQLSADESYDDRPLRGKVETEGRGRLLGQGIKLLDFQILRLVPSPEVNRQYTEFWLANQYRKDMAARADGTAYLLEEAETARASADMAMIQAIVDGVRRAQQDSGMKLSGDLVAIRLLDSLRQMFASSSQELQDNGGDIVEVLSGIHEVDERLVDLESKLRMPPPKFIPSRSS